MNRFSCWFVKITAYIPQLLCFRTKIHYKNKKAQGRRIKGAAVLVSNHTSVWDFAALMFVFIKRNMHCLMAELLFKKNKIFSIFLTHLGGIKAERGTFDFRFIEKSAEVLKKGGVVEIFPESRLPLPGEKRPLPFKPSAAYIAMLADAPIIPVYTDGNYFSLKRAHIMIGEKIEPSEIMDENLSEKENIEKLTNHLQKVITELGNELEKEIKAE